ncbi:MAG: response regulator transcription factor [Dehalococcoidales bacterium]|nr:response regulator transcription factor [Dehalococcoidales bacterium]
MRVLIIDGHDIFQQGLEKILQCEPGIEVVSHCGALWEKAVIENKPDIVIIDICLEQINPFELIRQVLQSEPNIKFVVLTYSELRKDLISSFEAGVSAYISKHIDIKNLIQVINRVSRGGSNHLPSIEKRFHHQDAYSRRAFKRCTQGNSFNQTGTSGYVSG